MRFRPGGGRARPARRSNRAVALLAAALAASVLGAGPSRPALAQAGAELPISTLGDMIVDPDYDRVYISGGVTGSTIEVYDFERHHLATLDEPGASGMVLRSEGVYVMVAGGERIDLIGRAGLEIKDSFPIPGAPSAPEFIGWAGGRVWFGLGSCDDDEGVLASLDPARRAVEMSAPSVQYHCTGVAAQDDGLGPSIFTFEADYESPNLTRRAVEEHATPAIVSEVIPHPIVDVAFGDYAELLYLAQDSLGTVAYDTTTLLPLWNFGTSPSSAVSVDVSDRLSVATGTRRDTSGADAVVNLAHDAQSGRPDDAMTFDVPDSGDGSMHVVPRGLGFHPGGYLFGVVKTADGRQWLGMADPQNAYISHEPLLGMSRSTDRTPGARVRFDISLREGPPPRSKVNMLVSSRVLGPESVGSVELDDQNEGKFVLRPLVSLIVWASYRGFESTYPTISDPGLLFLGPDVLVDLYGGRLEGRTVVYPRGYVPSFQGSVQPARGDRPLEFVSQFKRDGRWVLEDRTTFRTDERGLVAVRFEGARAGVDYRTRVRFGRHVSGWRRFRFEDGPSRRRGPASWAGGLRHPSRSLTGSGDLGTLLATHS